MRTWNTIPSPGAWVWPTAYQCILLSEYYLQTKDKSVLPTIQGIVDTLQGGQVADMAYYSERTHGKMGNVGNKFRTGGFGHITIVEGYGTMTITTALAVTALELAKDTGADVAQEKIDLARDYLRKSTTDGGYIGYHTKQGGYAAAGRQGLAIISHMLGEYSKENERYIKRVIRGLNDSVLHLNDAHADSVLGVCWGLLGANASGNEKALRDMMDYNKAWFNMARCHDGSFVALPGRDRGDKGYYTSSRLHLTGTMALVLNMQNSKLKIHGLNETGSREPKTADLPQLRKWHNPDGSKSFEGKLVSSDSSGGVVCIRRKNGKVITVNLTLLNGDDQKYVQKETGKNTQ
ncbi:DUF6288 domain-containing protein [Rubritalea profundi]|uniref:Squalene cyclase C-terminal domain-containing protein n=1 Tax=Rubritalea profundi TaxID=1658618 RepID=A0A2S7U090_9BACT|nr:DUF6288 domain-containing protein [Rubritalea profundi]PQJ27613.1 hypothetical protein BSZ32_03280 [Rubritalea profundi]